MDISRYAATPEAYDALSTYQIGKFFTDHGLMKDKADQFAAKLLGAPVSTTPVQGANSYSVSSDQAAQVVQFRRSELPIGLIKIARQLYGEDFVPKCTSRGMFGPVHVYGANLVPGPAFCRVRRVYFSSTPGMEERLQQTIQDFAKFFASAWVNTHAHASEPPPELFDEYLELLDEVSPGLPSELQEKLDEVRRGLPRLFRSSYPVMLQHDDLLENNIHVDEVTGHITGIVDWADAKIAPFGVSLASMEIVLGIQNRTNWHFHPNHHSLRRLFWDTFYEATGYISEDDQYTIQIARRFGFFRNHGPEEKEYAISYLSALCLV